MMEALQFSLNAPLICNPIKHGPEIGKHMQMKDLSPEKDIEVKKCDC